ncbi:glycosyltransferase family 4 protein [Terricaulis silvestris]|uniref:Glycosyltransferase KanE n=1 Tax=Terricaulis silvestris TaxID=2686094 RepID=A0A6I6MGI6_9CAUL|nr:glycosyltransferase family 4 protein [Terricaulis silvestris]QGZ93399.1 Glycosyltransferase KanE [Terricaulis silvestris]
MTPPPPRILALFGSGVLFGQERGNIEALAALQDQGCDVLCLVRDSSWSKDIPSALESRGIAFCRVPYIEQRMPGRLFYFLFRNPIAFILANIAFFWVFARYRPSHIYAFNSLYALNFLFGLALTRTPMVYRAGDAPTRHSAPFRWLWSFVVRRTQRFVAISRFIEELLINTGVERERVSVIYNKPPQGRPKSNGFSPGADLQHPDSFSIVYVGQLIADKGVDVLIEAFRHVAPEFLNARLLIAGRVSEWAGDAWARELAARVAGEALIRDRVVFLGYVEDTPSLFRFGQIHVCPSLFEEPLGNVVMEAKEAGVGSIVFPSGGLPEMIENGVDGVVCTEKTALALANALTSYLKDPEVARRHGQAARASLQRFQINRFAERWRHVINAADREN